jgi:hypothetical protein
MEKPVNQIPVYYQNREYAVKQEQLQKWEASREADRQFADEVHRRAKESLSSHEIGELVDDLIRNYGLERAMVMLARTVQFREQDTQLSLYVRIHAAKRPTGFNESPSEIDPCICCQMLPALALDALYRKMAERFDERTIPEDLENEDEAEQER